MIAIKSSDTVHEIKQRSKYLHFYIKLPIRYFLFRISHHPLASKSRFALDKMARSRL